jgi:hypothetical protein
MFWAFGRTIATFPPSFVWAQSYIIDRLTDEDRLGGVDVGGGTDRDEVGSVSPNNEEAIVNTYGLHLMKRKNKRLVLTWHQHLTAIGDSIGKKH